MKIIDSRYPSQIEHNGQSYNNVVYTNDDYAESVIASYLPRFKPTDTFLEPFRGGGAFYNAMTKHNLSADWCEIVEGKDFLQYKTEVNWIFSNPPWSGRVGTEPMLHSFDIAEHVVYLAPLKAFSTYKKWQYPLKHGFNEPTITPVPWKKAGLHYIDGKLKGEEGFMLCLLEWSKK